MGWLIFIAGIAVGTVGYYLYDRYAGSITTQIQKTEARLVALKAKL